MLHFCEISKFSHQPTRPAAIQIAVLLMALTGCSHFEDRRWVGKDPVVRGWPKSPQNSQFVWQQTAAVAVYSFPAPIPPASSPLSIKDLSDRGQAQLISALTAASARSSLKSLPDDQKDPGDAIRAIVSKPLTAKTPALASSEGHYDRVLVSDVTEGIRFEPGDRLEWTWVDIIPDNFKFGNYTIAATDNELQNVEQVQSQTTALAQAQANKGATVTGTATTPVGSAGSTLTNALGLTGQLTHQYTTTATINQQYTKLNVDIVPDELRVFRASERNLDAAGNTVIALSLDADLELFRTGGSFSNQARVRRSLQITSLTLFDQGKRVSPEKVKLSGVLNEAPPRCDLTATVTMIYRWRHITAGRGHYTEGRHHVEDRIEKVTRQHVVIVPKNEVLKQTWTVLAERSSEPAVPVEIEDLAGREQKLAFTNYVDARSFADWLSWNINWLRGTERPSLGKTGYRLISAVPPAHHGFDVERTIDPVTDYDCAQVHYTRQPSNSQKLADGSDEYPNPQYRPRRGRLTRKVDSE